MPVLKTCTFNLSAQKLTIRYLELFWWGKLRAPRRKQNSKKDTNKKGSPTTRRVKRESLDHLSPRGLFQT